MSEIIKITGEVTELHLDSDTPYIVVLVDEADEEIGGQYANIFIPESLLDDVEYTVSEGHQVQVTGKEKASRFRKKVLCTKLYDVTEDEVIVI